MNTDDNDFDLVKRFHAGEDPAFNRLAAKYQEKIYWHARKMTGNHLDADDIMQEVLMVMYAKLKDFRFQSSLYTWIYKVTATRSINMLRKRKIKNFFSLNDDDNPIQISAPTDLAGDYENKEKITMIEKFLIKLPVKQREVFIMRNNEQLSYEEISQITGTSVGALKANYFHAVDKMQKLMKDVL